MTREALIHKSLSQSVLTSHIFKALQRSTAEETTYENSACSARESTRVVSDRKIHAFSVKEREIILC